MLTLLRRSQLIDMPSTTVYRSFAELEAAKNAKPPASHAGAKKGWGSCSIVLAEGAFIDVLADARVVAGAAGWNMLEQHSDANSIEGHRSTATEIMQQIPGVTDVVCSTGTGATAAGLRAFLPENVKVHARPAISGSIDGLSDVNRYNNFCDTSKLENYNECVFDKDTAVANTQELQEAYGIVAGPSSGACWWLAKSILERDPSKKVATICADGSLPPSAFRERQQTVPRTWSEEIQTLTHRYGPVDVPPQDFSNGLWSPLPRRNGRKRHARSHNRHTSRSRMSTMVGGLGVRTSRHAGRPDGGRRAMSTSVERGYPPMEDAKFVDNIVIGGGPVGASAAWFLAETEAVQEKGESVMCIFDPKDKGAHEDWSRLARLSFDGPREEFDLSHHALETLERIEEVRSMQSGQPVVPIKPGMLFLASPGTPMALACANGEANYGDDEFVRRSPDELGDLYPGNNMEIPKDTLCWTHPAGLCVSPLELAGANLKTAGAYGVSLVESRAQVDVAGPDGELLVTLENGEKYSTKRCFLFAGARSKEILAQALERNPEGNAELSVPEFDDTYISAISTVRYRHRNTPSGSDDASVCVAPPITLGQLDGILPYQANFSVVAEEYGDVLKTRLSGDVGTETIDDVGGLAQIGLEGGQDAAMAETYSNFFCSLFPYLDDTPLDFNRCVTYRNHNPHFSGTSLLQKSVGSSSLYTSVGCFGVGVKFGPVLGEAAAAHAYGEELHEGMHVFASGSEELAVDESVEQLERAW